MGTLLRCLFGPRLHHIYQTVGSVGHNYEPGFVEKTGDAVVKWFRFCWSFSYWTSPVILIIMYRRGAFTPEGLVTMTTYGSSLGIVLAIALWCRALGRFMNTEYKQFLSALREARLHMNNDNKRKLAQYDFEFTAWPLEFTAKSTRAMVQLSESRRPRGIADKVKALPCHILSYLAINTFGRRFVYPGSTSLLKTLVAPMLLQGRIKLIEEYKAVRYKLRTEDSNDLATVVVDRRNNPDYPNGETLVICCEGNAGFYEIGCMATPLEAGYSTLGWNRPGFTGSSGQPTPGQEQNAINAVMLFATQKLGFPLYNIIVYGWSIGGYPVTWAAMNYPQVKSVIIDATFDDLTPLAIARMPPSWETLVRLTIKTYMNLRVVDQLCKYQGPILVIRRSRDEMITTLDPSIKSSNRGNFLLMKLLKFRYPNIVNQETLPILTQWLSKEKADQMSLLTEYGVDDGWCNAVLTTYAEEFSTEYPLLAGEALALEDRKVLTLFLASKHMDEFDATHCQPLPASFFRDPWHIQ